MDPLDGVEIAIGVAMVVLGAIFAWRQWQARRLARAAPAVQAAVVSVKRVESGSRVYAWFVDTLYDVPGRGVLRHRKGFEKEGPALLFSRLHREGSVHWVVPNEVEEGQVFLMEELQQRADWTLHAGWLIVAGATAYAVYSAAVEYWGP